MTVARPLTNQVRIYRDLRQRIESGEYPPDSQLPSIRELARSYDSSKGVLQIVINRLQHDSLLVTRHGKGLYARRPPQFRRILLLNPTTGHEWADYTNGFIQHLGKQDDLALMVESADARESDELAAKIELLLAEKLDTILFNGLPDFRLGFISKYASKVNLLCFYSDLELRGQDASIGRVVSDWHSGGRIGMEHLINVGCQHVAVISHQPHPLHTGVQVNRGIQEAIQRHGGAVKLSRFVGDHAAEEYAEQFTAFMHAHPDVDGLFAESDVRVAKLLPILRRLGRRVPDDVAVLGYYNTPWATAADPSLSSICTNPTRMVEHVSKLLIDRRFTERRVVEQSLVVRASTLR